MSKAKELINYMNEAAPFHAVSTAAMSADRAVRQSSVSIFTAIEDAAKKQKVPVKEVEAMVIKMFPKYEGAIAMGNKGK